LAYSDSIGDNAQLLKRTITHVADFSGRSRRTEVIYYWIAGVLAGITLDFALTTTASFRASLLVSDALEFAFLVPMLALFVRRIHDQNRSGWWGWLLPLSVLLSLPQRIAEFHADPQVLIAEKVTPVGIVAGLCSLAVLVLCLLPGTDGTNHYGPDPRLEEL